MKNIECVIDVGFGDSGKGLVTDYLCHRNKDKKEEQILNVRYNGGFQAGHTVLRDKNMHVFRGIGAGATTNNVHTYFSEQFILNQGMLELELESLCADFKLIRTPQIYVNSNCRISLVYDEFLNISKESYRASNKNCKPHGSCGLGIFETVKRNRCEEYSLKYSDLYNGAEWLKERLTNIRDNYFTSELRKVGYIDSDIYQFECFKTEDFIEGQAKKLLSMKKLLINIDEETLFKYYDHIVFEGAQGLMLDEDNVEYMPNLTPSHPGLNNIVVCLKSIKSEEIESLNIYYVTRSYATRHGEGKLEHEVDKSKLGRFVGELSNKFNLYQGSFRFGRMSMENITTAVNKDLKQLEKVDKHIKVNKNICVTCLDQTNNKINTSNGELRPQELAEVLGMKLIRSYGRTAKDIVT